MRWAFVIAGSLVISAAVLVGQQPSAPAAVSLAPDVIYYGGKVVTVDQPFSIAEAFAIKGTRFIAVGKNAEIRALAGSRTQQVDLGGRTVIPGLMDNHNHQIWKSRNMHRGAQMAGVKSIPEMMDRLKAEAAKVRPGQPVMGSGDWNRADLAERRSPTKAEMDAAVPNNPVFLFDTGRNNAFLNSASLKVLGIDFNTTDWGSFPILRDVKGEPTGELSGGEQVYAADLKMLPQPSYEESIKWLEEQQAFQHSLGLTSIRELVNSPMHLRTYQEMHRQGRLTMRVSSGIMFGVQHVDGWNPVQIDEYLTAFPSTPGLGDDTLSLDGTLAEFEVTTQRVATWNRPPNPAAAQGGRGGAPGGRGGGAAAAPGGRGGAAAPGGAPAAAAAPAPGGGGGNAAGLSIAYWPHSPLLIPVFGENGALLGIHRLPTEMFQDVVKKMNRYGYRPGFHVSGDAALDWHLDAYEAADREQSIKDKRWVVEHNGGPDPQTMDRIVKLNMIVSLQWQSGPLKTQMDHGEMITFGSDYPAFDSNPFHVMALHITRRNAQGVVNQPEEKISRERALRAATINNAFLMFREKDKGSIEAGKLADFLVLSADIMTVPEEQIGDITPVATFVGAKKVFARPGSGF